MPDISSLEVLRQIKSSSSQLAKTQIILLCDHRNQVELEGLLENGCDMLIIKPIDSTNLVRQINAVLPVYEEVSDQGRKVSIGI